MSITENLKNKKIFEKFGIKIGAELTLRFHDQTIRGIISEIDNDMFYFLQNVLNGGWQGTPPFDTKFEYSCTVSARELEMREAVVISIKDEEDINIKNLKQRYAKVGI